MTLQELRSLSEDRWPAAGESLRSHGEQRVRENPREALLWIQSIERGATHLPPLLRSYASWTGGVVRHLSGRSSEAKNRLEEAARGFQSCRRQNLADRVRIILIDVLGESGETARARQMAGRIHTRFIRRGEHEHAASTLINLGCAEDAADRVARARALWRQALKMLSEEDPRRLHVLGNLANADLVAGHFDRAVAALAKVSETARSTGKASLALLAELNLAEAEHASGQVDRSLKRWHRTLDRARSCGNLVVALAAEAAIAESEIEIGDVASATSRVSRCLPEAREAGLGVEIRRFLRLDSVANVARGPFLPEGYGAVELESLGFSTDADLLRVDLAPFDPTADPADLERAARRLDKAGLRYRSRLADAWAARRWSDLDRPTHAQRAAKRVLSGRRPGILPRMIAHHALGRSTTGPTQRHLALAVRDADLLLSKLVARSDRAAFLTSRSDIYLDRVEQLLSKGDSKNRRAALDLLDRFRAGWMVEQLSLARRSLDDPLLDQWQKLRLRLSTLLDNVEGPGEARIRRSGLQVYTEVSTIHSKLRELEVRLGRHMPWGFPSPEKVSLSRRLLDRLPPGHLYLEMVQHGDDIVVFSALDGHLQSRRLRGTGPEVTRLAASARFHLDAATEIEGSMARASSSAFAHTVDRLRALLVEPVFDPGRPITVWVGPHAFLFHLPWAAMITECPTTVVPGVGSAVELLEHETPNPRRVDVLGMGDGHLPMVLEEVEKLAAGPDRVKRTPRATRADLLDALLNADVVHLAGHALFLDDTPSASGLRLADGWVTVHDLAASPISSRLVSFGVCSGMRISSSGGYRAEGFLRALLGQGVRTVVGPVAPVADEVAHAFSMSFFEALWQHGSPGDAFTAAVDVIQSTHASPTTWGNFQIFGDPRPWGAP